MENFDQKVEELGLKLPVPPTPGGDYVPARQSGNLLYCSGVLSVFDGDLMEGQVGKDQTIETGFKGAEVCALNVLSVIKATTGSLNSVKQIVYVGGYVNGISGFAESPQVINGASAVFGNVFGEAGKHARAAVAVAGLPKNATVEIQVVVELK